MHEINKAQIDYETNIKRGKNRQRQAETYMH